MLMSVFSNIAGPKGIDRVQLAINEKTGRFKNIAYVVAANQAIYDKILSKGPTIPFYTTTVTIESSSTDQQSIAGFADFPPLMPKIDQLKGPQQNMSYPMLEPQFMQGPIYQKYMEALINQKMA
jgi:hypothetical protein